MKQRKPHYFVDNKKPKGSFPPEYYRYYNGVWQIYDKGWHKVTGDLANSYEKFISGDSDNARLIRITEEDFTLSQI